MVALSNYEDMVTAAMEEGIDLIISGAGLPLELPKYRPRGSKTKLVPIVSTARAAKIIISRWQQRYNYLPDAFVVEGPQSGGHQGVKFEDINNPEYQIEKTVPEVIELVKQYAQIKEIPIIAAGGLFTGKDIKKFLELGCGGVQMGSRFIGTHECDADIKFKEQFINIKNASDITVIKSPVGLPLRIINSKYVKEITKNTETPKNCPFKCLVSCDYTSVPFCIAFALINARKGNVDKGVMCCGSNGYRIDKLYSVKELIGNLKKEYDEIS